MALANEKALAKAQQNGSGVARCTNTRTYTDSFGNFSKTQCKLFAGHTGNCFFDPSDIPDVEATTDEQGLRLTFRIPLI